MTLIGNGWLRESPRNIWPREWDIRSRSALRKCMFLPVAPHLLKQLGENAAAAAVHVSPAALPPKPQLQAPVVYQRQDPKRHAREFPAVPAAGMRDAPQAALYAEEKAKLLAGTPPATWYEDPVALGALLILFPPIGLAALWSSRRYSSDARWALTVMTGLTLCLASAVIVAVIALKS